MADDPDATHTYGSETRPESSESTTEELAIVSGRESIATRFEDAPAPVWEPPPVPGGGPASDHKPMPDDRYAVRALLGAGGMGKVLLAYDNDIQRPIAMKRMNVRYESSRGARQRFLTEVRIAGQLEHPNITPVHDVGVDAQGRPYYTMRFVEGEHLGRIIQRLQRGDPGAHAHWSFERRIELFLSVCSALSFAHSRGYLHRDLKPDNIMVGEYGEVFVVDWGIAKLVGSDEQARDDDARERLPGSGSGTRTGAVLGTLRYMSPEQARGEVEDLDARADVYALGVVLYEFLTLRHPLDPMPSDLSPASLRAHLERHAPVAAESIRSPHQRAVPVDLSRVIAKAMSLEREQRFASVADLREALVKVLEGNSPVQCSRTLTVRLLRLVIRLVHGSHYLGVLSVLGVFCFAALGLSISVWALLLVFFSGS